MKRSMLSFGIFILAIIFFNTQTVLGQNIEKILLHEVFISSTDPGSVGANSTIKSILDANPGKWTCIKYPMNWPGGGDPYYTAEGGERKNYYGIGYVPHMELNGGWNSNPAGYNQTIFDQFYNVATFMEIDAVHTIDIPGQNIEVDVTINPHQAYLAGLKLHIVVVENTTTGNVGTNGETEFHYIMMKMIPDENGTDVGPFTSGTQQTYTMTASLAGTNIEEYTDLSVVVFVQDNSSKDVYQSAWSVLETPGTGLEVSCKTFLQGAYISNSLMDTALTELNPGTHPYNVAPWNYNGTENINSIPDNMVDWVLVELRDPANPTRIISRRAAILLNNGNVADTNLTTSIKFPDIPAGNYYLCIYHRNHFPVLSANPFPFPNSIRFDFSDTLGFPPYGGGVQALIMLEFGIFGMIAGDVNKDGKLKYSGPGNDRGPVLQYIVNESGSTSITTTVSGYRNEDINMDSIIKYSGPGNDPSVIIQNLVGLTGSTSITSVYNSIVPEGIPLHCSDSLIDSRDGKVYAIVWTGTQCWMAENLAYLPSVSPSSAGSETSPYYYVYDYQGTDVSAAKATSNYQTYGVLYNWAAAMASEASSDSVPSGVQGICPSGWHLPSDEEWKILEGAVDSQYGYPDPEWDGTGWRGTDAGGNLKETGTIHWQSSNSGATNSSGYTALPGGNREIIWGSFSNLSRFTFFWSSTEYSSSNVWLRLLTFTRADLERLNYYKVSGYSCRCIKDAAPCIPQPTQSDAGRDSLNIAGDSIGLMGNTPVIGQGLWTVFTGNGGSFADSTNPTTLFYGLPGMTYHLVWTISNNCGSSSDTVVISFATQAFVCGDLLNDVRDGQSYNTVQIGTQCWMAENLNIGSVIDNGITQTDNGIIEKHCFSNGIADSCDKYGGLYQWDEMMQYSTSPGIQGICPSGWHLPTDAEWKLLEGTVDSQYGVGNPEWDNLWHRGFDAGKKLKATSGWPGNGNGTDEYGFAVIPRSYLADFAWYWTSNEEDALNSWVRSFYYDQDGVYRSSSSKTYSDLVRCLMDCSPQPGQSDAGQDSLYINGDSIALMGNTPVNGQGLWAIFSGSGGSFADSTNPTTLFYGLTGMTYHLVWTISNSCGSSSDTVVIGFATQGFVCGDPLIDNRDGQTYNTTQIGSQCWMAESINIGTMINSSNNSQNNTTIEKYCYDNDLSNCNNYGGLYQWDEMMQYASQEGVQGICMTGWHIPSDSEWKIMEGTADSQYGVGDPEWDLAGSRGYNAGLNLKSTTGWNTGSNGIDLYGFKGIPSGYKRVGNSFNHLGQYSYLFTSSTNNSGTQSLKIEGTTDLLFKLGDKTTGQYIVKYYLYFPAGYGGYYNFQRFETPGIEWAFECHFQTDGTGHILAAGSNTAYTYDHDRWFQVEHKINLDTDVAEFFIDGTLIHTWQYSIQMNGNPGTVSLGSVNFYPSSGTNLYYVDDINYFNQELALNWNDFESYTLGSLIADQSPSWWTTWSGLPGSAEDAPVVDDQSKTGTYAWYRGLTGYNEVYRVYKFKERAFAVRCVKDTVACTPLPDQANAGPDSIDITGDSIILMANTPVIGQGLWAVLNGTGGSFADSINPTTLFYGLPGMSYHLVWTISNNCGSSSDTVVISFATQGFVCGDLFNDVRDGHIYNTTLIGSQCWMAENLAYLPSVSPSSQGSETTPYYYVYDYQGTDVNAAKATSNYQTYGVLYNWPAVMAGDASSNSVPSGVQGICPAGWHLPGDEEWKILEGEVDSQYGYPDPEWDGTGWRGTDVGGNLKETGTTHWGSPNNGATNSSGFNILPAGLRYLDGSFGALGSYAYFWLSVEGDSSRAWSRYLCYDNADVCRHNLKKRNGWSVRCTKD